MHLGEVVEAAALLGVGQGVSATVVVDGDVPLLLRGNNKYVNKSYLTATKAQAVGRNKHFAADCNRQHEDIPC
jgi:hypothetical protein